MSLRTSYIVQIKFYFVFFFFFFFFFVLEGGGEWGVLL